MWSRRRFLESLSTLPVVRGFVGRELDVADGRSARAPATT